MRRVCLMYHDVYDGVAPAADIAPGAARYHVSREAFRRHLDALVPYRDSVSITFDDGWRGSLTVGVELLREAGLEAIFFVTRDFVGAPHFADASLVREAQAEGMAIGTHGTTHRFLSTLPPGEIEDELSSSKAYLEDLLGADVKRGSVPGGAWSPTVAAIARGCGYDELYTSRPGVNDAATDPFALRRVAIRQDTTAQQVASYARGDVRREVVRAALLQLPRRLLGRERYASLRARMLGGGEEPEPGPSR